MPNTPVLGLPYPASADTADAPRDMQALAVAMDGQPSMIPVGGVMLWPVATPPAGALSNGKAAWLIANGQVVSAADYPKLAALLGQVGGNVTIPDLRDRVPVGASATKALLSKAGEELHTITAAELPAHTHPDTIAYAAGGSHSHGAAVAAWNYIIADGSVTYSGFTVNAASQFRTVAADGSVSTARSYDDAGSTAVGGSHSHTKSGGVSASAAPTQQTPLLQPYLTMNYVMRAA